MRRVLCALPLLVPALLLSWETQAPLLGLVPGLLLFLAAAVGPRLRAGGLAQGGLGVVAMGLGFALGSALQTTGPEPPLHPVWAALAAGVLLLLASRHLCTAPLGGARGTWALGLAALIACGVARVGPLYPAAAFLYLGGSLFSLRAASPGRLPWARQTRRVLGVLLLPGAAAVACGLIAPLRPLADWIQERIELAYGEERARSGFSGSLRLGALRGVLDSEEVVARVYAPAGAVPESLRGVVYNRYQNGHWLVIGMRPQPLTTERLPEPAGARDPGLVEVNLVRTGADQAFLFLPLDLAALATEAGSVLADAMGGLRRFKWDRSHSVFLRLGERRVAPIAPPGARDLEVPPANAGALAELAARWIGPESTAEGKLRRLMGRLQHDYRYSLSYERPPERDPVLDFLLTNRQGHCEYFASALALLGRAAGIPTRVVGGYRVAERNRLGGYHVVRQRNAHAWVEAYLPGRGWTSYDPTPASELPQNRAHESTGAAALLDLAVVLVSRARAWADRRSPEELLLALAALLLLLLGVQRYLRRRRAAVGTARGDLAFRPPLPSFQRLSEVLARNGLARAPWETLEGLAERAPDPQAAQLLRRYASLRYGGQGDERELCAQMDAYAARRALSAPPPLR